MNLEPTSVEGCFVVSLDPREDERGYFARAWCAEVMAEAGIADHVEQINMSRCEEPGMIRGLHWQADPHGEAKFIRTIVGRTYNVCADARPSSPTYGNWVGVELSPENRLALVIPEGCANGYQALEPGSEVLYLTSSPYVPGVERGIRFDDPHFNIGWPIRDQVQVSDKDAGWDDFVP